MLTAGIEDNATCRRWFEAEMRKIGRWTCGDAEHPSTADLSSSCRRMSRALGQRPENYEPGQKTVAAALGPRFEREVEWLRSAKLEMVKEFSDQSQS